MKIVFFVCSVTLLGLLSYLCYGQDQSPPVPDRFVALASAFPANTYTPHGYIDNPYHSMVFNRSGVIRSFPPLGFGWWRAEFKGNYGGGVRDHVNYISILQMSVIIGAKGFVRTDDFTRLETDLHSAYHSKHVVSYDWSSDSVTVSLKYFLPREHTLACLVELTNAANRHQEVILDATHAYAIGDTKWWGSDGLTAKYSVDEAAHISKVWAYGDVFVLGSNLRSVAHTATDREAGWEDWIRNTSSASLDAASARGRGPLWAAQRYRLDLPPGLQRSSLVILARGKN
ncbi:MAG: hypothetical protein AABZ02_09420 [Bacteroidota bacterium]